MTKYREIKHLVHAENIVFWHAVQERLWTTHRSDDKNMVHKPLVKSCIINVPALLIFQKPVFTDLIGLKWLTFLCLSATSATLLSNTALQACSNTFTLSRYFETMLHWQTLAKLQYKYLKLIYSVIQSSLCLTRKSSQIQGWFQWHKVSTCQWPQ